MTEVFYLTEGIFTKEEINSEKSPLKAIRNYCRYSCCCNDLESWRDCKQESCFLYKFRFGNNPNNKRVLTEEQKEQKRKLLKENKEKSILSK